MTCFMDFCEFSFVIVIVIVITIVKYNCHCNCHILLLETCVTCLIFIYLKYLARRLGFDSLWFGYLQTTIGMIQLLGGPVFGR